MFFLIAAIIIFVFDECYSELSYESSKYCSNCVLGNNDVISRDFGFGGGDYGTTSQSPYLLPKTFSYLVPSDIANYFYGSNGYDGAHPITNMVSTTVGKAWPISHSFPGNYAASYGNTYTNCDNTNCYLNPTHTSVLTPTLAANIGIGYGSMNSNSISGTYSSLPTSYGYTVPSAYGFYGTIPALEPAVFSTYTHSNSPNTYYHPRNRGSHSTVYGNYGAQSDNSNLKSNIFSLSSYQRSKKAAAVEEVQSYK